MSKETDNIQLLNAMFSRMECVSFGDTDDCCSTLVFKDKESRDVCRAALYTALHAYRIAHGVGSFAGGIFNELAQTMKPTWSWVSDSELRELGGVSQKASDNYYGITPDGKSYVAGFLFDANDPDAQKQAATFSVLCRGWREKAKEYGLLTNPQSVEETQ